MLIDHFYIIIKLMVLLLATSSLADAGADTVTIISAPGFEAQGCHGQQCITELASYVGCIQPYKNACLCASYVRGDAISHLSSCAFATLGYIACLTPLEQVEYTAAVSIYNRYCASNAYTLTVTEPASEPSMTVDAATALEAVASTVFATFSSLIRDSSVVVISTSQLSTTIITGSIDTDLPYTTSPPTWKSSVSVSSSKIQIPSAPSTDKTDNDHNGLSQAEKIALGVGLSVPIASLVLGLIIYFRPHHAERIPG